MQIWTAAVLTGALQLACAAQGLLAAEAGAPRPLSSSTSAGGYPPPWIVSVSPGSVPAGGPAFSLTVDGTNFRTGSVIQWNGSPRPSTQEGSTRILASISAADIASSGTAYVTVLMPGDGPSNAVPFQVASHASAVSPSDSPPDPPAGVKCYPNPLKPPQGQRDVFCTNLPSGAGLKVYDLRGVLLKSLSADSAGTASWDGTNLAGAEVASGVYFVLIDNGGDQTTYTLAVER